MEGRRDDAPTGWTVGQPRPDPYAAEKPLAVVEAANIETHKAKLSEGQLALLAQAAEVPTRTTLTAVMFIDAKRGWAVGHGGLVLATLDGGEHWKVQFGRQEAENSLFSVWF